MGDDISSGEKGLDAYQLFPDIMSKFSAAKKVGSGQAVRAGMPPPPGPPDISWLEKGKFESVSWISDIPTALLVMPEGEKKAMVRKAFEGAGYLVEGVSSEQEAVKRMKFVNLAGMVLQIDKQKNPLEKSILHSYMRRLSMSRRRLIYYVLIGPGFNTLYDLQALSLSVNLVVNDRDVGKLDLILRRGLQEYENLFGPLLLTMREYGRR
jgi:hypothetical protein